MSIDAVDGDAFFDYANWLLETGLWDGREVTWEQAADFQNEIEQRILDFLFSEDPSSFKFQQFAAHLAWVGADEGSRDLLARDIQALKLTSNGTIVEAGFWKDVGKFWKEHKKAILIGTAVVGVVTAVVAVAVCSFGAGTGAAIAAGSAALGGLGDKNEDSPESKPLPSKDVPSLVTSSTVLSDSVPSLKKPPAIPSFADTLNKNPEKIPTPPFFNTPLPFAPSPLWPNAGTPPGQVSYSEKGIKIGDQYFPYNEAAKWIDQNTNFVPQKFLPPASPSRGDITLVPPKNFPFNFGPNGFISQPHGISSSPSSSVEISKPPELPPSISNKSWVRSFFETIGRGMTDPDLLNSEAPLPHAELSTYIATEGNKLNNLAILGINGINTSFEGMKSHVEYLKQFVPDQSIGWVHNRSHSAPVDLLEVFFANYFGYSPRTAELLTTQWTEFHEINKYDPDAKVLQFCHSQGAIHVRNALAKAPEEIRNRVIVISIAPGAVVPSELCFESFNYASEKDIVHQGELIVAGALDTNEFGMSKYYEMVMKNHEQLILLKPHLGATGIDHDFQSLTFFNKIRDHINDYLSRNGRYKNKGGM